MADHYADHPAVIGWQTDNRIWRSLPLRTVPGGVSHVAATQIRLARRAQHSLGYYLLEPCLHGLGADSRSAGDCRTIRQRVAQSGPGIDYYRFMSDTYVAFQHEQVDILRSTCPTHFITHNLMGAGYDRLDYFDLAADLDFVSWDNYRRMQWTFRPEVPPSEAALSHAVMRGLKQQNFWVMEQQAGSGGWQIVSVAPQPGELQLWAYQSIAHGADAIIFFRWRTAHWHRAVLARPAGT